MYLLPLTYVDCLFNLNHMHGAIDLACGFVVPPLMFKIYQIDGNPRQNNPLNDQKKYGQ